MSSVKSRQGAARASRVLLGGVAIPGLLLAVIPLTAASAAVAHPGPRRVTYLGNSFTIPRGWPVINLARHRRACVRFDRHAVYLGTPAPDQACPSVVIGTTEAMLIGPAARHAAARSVEDRVARRITVVTRRLHIIATFGTDPGVIDRILASDRLPRPATGSGTTVPGDQPRPAAQRAAAQGPLLPANTTDFHGKGFDTCAAPSARALAAWRLASPYRAVGVYIGGSDQACAQPNLTPSWLRQAAGAGWHFIPMYVGPQAVFDELGRSSGRQGAAVAADAARQARALGFGPKAPIYYDMEAYLPPLRIRVLRFLSAWTTTLHSLGYSSGVYSSSASGVADLAHQFRRHRYAMPDVIFDALWNRQASTSDPVVGPGEWSAHRRLHQYRGNIRRTYGGVRMDIDRDFLDVRLAPPAPSPSPFPSPPSPTPQPPTPTPTMAPQPTWTPLPSPLPTVTRQAHGTPAASQAVTQPDGTVDVFYRGADGGLWYLRYVAGRGWTRPAGLGGHVASAPSAVAEGTGGLRVLYRGVDGFLWQVRTRPGGWAKPWALRQLGVSAGRPMAVTRSSGVTEVFWRNAAGALCYAEHPPGLGWSDAFRLGGRLASDPSPVITSRGALQVLWTDPAGALWHLAGDQDGWAWSGPARLGTPRLDAPRLGSRPRAVPGPRGTVEVFWLDRAGTAVVTGSFTASGRWWGPHRLDGARPSSPPLPVAGGGPVQVFARDTAGRLWLLAPASPGWPGRPPRVAATRVAAAPFAAVGPGGRRLDVFWWGRGPHGGLWWLRVSPGNRASRPRPIGDRVP